MHTTRRCKAGSADGGGTAIFIYNGAQVVSMVEDITTCMTLVLSVALGAHSGAQ